MQLSTFVRATYMGVVLAALLSPSCMHFPYLCCSNKLHYLLTHYSMRESWYELPAWLLALWRCGRIYMHAYGTSACVRTTTSMAPAGHSHLMMTDGQCKCAAALCRTSSTAVCKEPLLLPFKIWYCTPTCLRKIWYCTPMLLCPLSTQIMISHY